MTISQKLPSYPKIHGIPHRQIVDIFKGTVYVQEKYDASQFTFGVIDGELLFRSKKVQVFGDDSDANFGPTVKALTAIKDRLTPGYIYRGEAFRSCKHNALRYEREPENNIVIFDIQREDRTWVLPEEVKAICDAIGLEAAHTYSLSGHEARAFLVDFIGKTQSTLGGTTIEGLVFKNYGQSTPMGDPCFGKLVREDFQEMNSNARPKTAKKDVLEMITETFKTEPRWEKAYQHLRDEGNISGELSDIGKLMPEVMRDIEEECVDEIKDMLFKQMWPKIRRSMVHGLPEWYKAKLAEQLAEEMADG